MSLPAGVSQEAFLLQNRFGKMSSKIASRKKSKRRPRYLQALRDFSAADACFSDGANPLSFHIGEIFTFLSRRDSYWVNVERTIWKNKSLLKTKDYPTIERGIVPVDYVIEMDSTTKQSGRLSAAKSEDCLVSTSEDSQDDFFKVSQLYFRLCETSSSVPIAFRLKYYLCCQEKQQNSKINDVFDMVFSIPDDQLII